MYYYLLERADEPSLQFMGLFALVYLPVTLFFALFVGAAWLARRVPQPQCPITTRRFFVYFGFSSSPHEPCRADRRFSFF